MKLCNGLLYLTAVFCGIEALKLARAYGIDEQTVFDVAALGTGNSWYVQNPHFLDNMMLSHPTPMTCAIAPKDDDKGALHYFAREVMIASATFFGASL